MYVCMYIYIYIYIYVCILNNGVALNNGMVNNVWHSYLSWHAATSILTSFYQGTDPKGFVFLETFRNLIY